MAKQTSMNEQDVALRDIRVRYERVGMCFTHLAFKVQYGPGPKAMPKRETVA